MNGRPRILLLTNSLAVGGAETQLVRLAVHLHSAGYPVMVATILPDGRGRPELRDAGIHHEVLPLRSPIGGLTVMAGTIRLVRRWRPDAVISFLFYANLLGRLAGALTRVPVVVSSVRNERFGGRVSDAALRLTDRLARRTVTNSHGAARRLVADRIVPEHRLVVIPNGISLDAMSDHSDRSELRRRLGVSDEGFLWLAIGRLEPQKDYPTLLQAMAELRDDGSGVHLRIAGEGSQRAAMQSSLRDLDLLDVVGLLGLRDDIPGLLSAADALVLPSRWEGLPNGILEAFAAGVPVVATECGGTAELVEPGVTGLLVPPGDSRALAEAMRELMRLPAGTRSAMGAAGRRVVADRFAIGQVMNRWEGLINELTLVAPRTRETATATSHAGGV